jgi:outer membrane protein assembly factor BamB
VSWYSWSDDQRIFIADLARSPADGSPLVGHVSIPLPAEHRGASLVDELVIIGDGDPVFAAQDVVVRMGAGGEVVWSHDLGPGGPRSGLARSGVARSRDGAIVWVYAADAMADRGDGDRLLALDARTGKLLVSAVLDSVGHSAELLAHDDGSLVVGVAQGQDGGVLYLVRFDHGVLTMRELTGALHGDRVPCGFSPDGTRLLTCDYEGPDDVAVHSWPDGAVLATFTAEDLVPESLDGEMPVLEYGAGFLDDGRVLVTVKGEVELEENFVEWAVPVVIDLASSTAGAVAAPGPAQRQGPVPLGDGTWVAVDRRPEGSDAPLVRRRYSTSDGRSANGWQ